MFSCAGVCVFVFGMDDVVCDVCVVSTHTHTPKKDSFAPTPTTMKRYPLFSMGTFLLLKCTLVHN